MSKDPRASGAPVDEPPAALPAERPASAAVPPAPGPSRAPAPFRWYEPLTRDPDRGVLGGVAAGVAEHLGVRVTPVRIAFVVLGLMGGAGAIAYMALWVLTRQATREVLTAGGGREAGRGAGLGESGRAGTPGRAETSERRRGIALLVIGVVGMVAVLSVSTATGIDALAPLVVIGIGAVLVWQEYDRGTGGTGGTAARRSAFEWARITGGVTLVVVGLAVVVLGNVEIHALRSSFLAVGATLVGVVLLTVPLWLRMWRTVEAERAARVREAERSDIASHLHDSVLQTLALIQKRSDEPAQVARLARRQERELRQWLFGSTDRMSSGATSVAGAVEVLCGEIEDAYELRISPVVVGGEVPLGEREEAVLGAVREALVNVGKHAGVPSADVFVEVDGDLIEAFVRDRGSGFDPEAVPEDRHGLAQSVRHRVESRGGRVTVRSTVGRGTEIGIEMPRAEE